MRIHHRKIDATIADAISHFNVPSHLYSQPDIPKKAPESPEDRAFAIVSKDFGLDENQQGALRRSMRVSNIDIRDLLSINSAFGYIDKKFGIDTASKIREIWRNQDNIPVTDRPFLDMMLECRIPEVAYLLGNLLGAPILRPKDMSTIDNDTAGTQPA